MTPTTPGKEPPKERRRGAKPAEEIVLGTLSEGPYDTELNAGAASTTPAPKSAATPVTAASRRPATAGGQAPQREMPAAGTPETTDESLALPPDAWLALRRSGGLLFSSREVVVYPDGRVESAAVGGGRPEGTGPPRRLTASQLTALRRAAGIDFRRLPPPSRRQPPDAYAYELVVHEGGRTQAVEVFDGAIPEALAPLLRLLGPLLSAED